VCETPFPPGQRSPVGAWQTGQRVSRGLVFRSVSSRFMPAVSARLAPAFRGLPGSQPTPVGQVPCPRPALCLHVPLTRDQFLAG
jgi:hypothetical protein